MSAAAARGGGRGGLKLILGVLVVILLLALVRGKLSDDERQLADLRALGREWGDIAVQVGGTAEARRKQLARAISRVSQELGLDNITDE